MHNLTQGLFRRSPDALFRRVGGEMILASRHRDDFDSLSSTASVAWELLDTPKGLDQLVQELASAYDMHPPTILPDVAALLLDLLRKGWVEEVSDNAG
jgi:hypothetical protein